MRPKEEATRQRLRTGNLGLDICGRALLAGRGVEWRD
jgi:hypothetical protein